VPFFKKLLRLPPGDYIGRGIYFVTLGTENRAKFFADLPTGQWGVERLLALSAGFGFSLHAYCAMPDHLHFLSEGLYDTCDLVKFVDGFKQRTAYEFSKTHGKRLWQRRYYDHILRPSEPVEDAACYIWWNPVRKGLCAEPNAYPLSGSQTIDWMKRSPMATNWKPSWKL
jgi:REP element-mobilizing transposase RayT